MPTRLPEVSRRSRAVIASPIRKFLPLVRRAEATGARVLKLNVGDPDLPTPQSFWRALRTYKPHTLAYAPSPGIPEHTLAWVKYFSHFGVRLTPEQVLPTVGGAEAILFALLVTCDLGDEVLVFEPLYSSYKGFAAMCNVKLIPVTLRVENGFALPPAKKIEQRITKRTRAMVVVNPSNPTGALLTRAEHLRIIKLARRHNLFIIADETYREIIFRGKPISFLQFPSARQHVIVTDSASKRFSMPGARIGCVASYNPEVMAAILRLAMIRLSAPSLEQYGLIPLLTHPTAQTKKITREYKLRRDVVVRELKRMPGVTVGNPMGAFYLIARLPIKNAEQFVTWLITKFRLNRTTVQVTPAEDFYITPGAGRNEIRIAYVLARPKLRQAMAILRRGLHAYAKRET